MIGCLSFFIASLAPCPPLQIIAFLPGVQFVSCNHANLAFAFRKDHSEKATAFCVPVVHVSRFAVRVLIADRNRIARQQLLCFVRRNSVGPNFPQVVPVPFEQYSSDCICNASLLMPGCANKTREETVPGKFPRGARPQSSEPASWG